MYFIFFTILYHTFADFNHSNNLTHSAIAQKVPDIIRSQNNIGYLENKAIDLYQKGNYIDAIHYLDKILTMNATNEMALVNKGAALNALGNFTESMKTFDKILAYNSSNEVALGYKGLNLQELGNYTESIKYYDQILKKHPDFPLALSDKGEDLYYLGDYKEALKLFDRSLVTHPEYKIALSYKNELLNKLCNSLNFNNSTKFNVDKSIDNSRNKTNSNINFHTVCWKTYENKKYRFKLTYPSTWKVENDSIPTSDLGLKIGALYDPLEPNPTEYVTLDISNIKYTSMDSIIKSYIAIMKNTSKNFKLLENEDTKINNIPAKKIEYIQSLPFFNMVKLNYLVKVKDNLFTFTFGEDIQTYLKYLKEIENIIKTFKIY